VQGASIVQVAFDYGDGCDYGDRYANNCAHFLSNAFIDAGYTELTSFGARCSGKRPIRAGEMWTWFQTKATESSRAVQHGTGWWALFMVDERQYWGGHVAILDSDTWHFYGTGWYDNWSHYRYRW
jgi:hypothetical protein